MRKMSKHEQLTKEDPTKPNLSSKVGGTRGLQPESKYIIIDTKSCSALTTPTIYKRAKTCASYWNVSEKGDWFYRIPLGIDCCDLVEFGPSLLPLATAGTTIMW